MESGFRQNNRGGGGPEARATEGNAGPTRLARHPENSTTRGAETAGQRIPACRASEMFAPKYRPRTAPKRSRPPSLFVTY